MFLEVTRETIAMRSRTRHTLSLATCVLALALPARAQTRTWDGSGDRTWTQPDSTDWSAETYDSGDQVQFLGSGAGDITITGA